MKRFVFHKAGAVALVASLLAGCATGANTTTASNTGVITPTSGVFNNGMGGFDRNTTIGAGSGAALGSAIGAAVSSRGNKNEGALIGAAIGGLLGGVIGNQYGSQIDQQIGQIGSVLAGTGANVTKMPDGSLKINLAGDVSFNSGSSAIKDTFIPTLNNVAKVINQTPNSRVVVVGHTDSTGSEAANMALSLARANSVRDFLITSGTSTTRISTSGRGSAQPVADNATEAGRAQNRRVEIFVFHENQ